MPWDFFELFFIKLRKLWGYIWREITALPQTVAAIPWWGKEGCVLVVV